MCAFALLCPLADRHPPTITEREVKTVIETLLDPQIQAYCEAFGINDLSVDIQFKQCDINEPLRDSRGKVISNGWVCYNIRDIIIAPSFFEILSQEEFTDELLKQLSAIVFEYPEIQYGDYKIFGMSALACPIFKDAQGNEYTVSEDVLLKGDIIAYIASDAHLEYDAKVGDNIYSVISPSGSSGNSSKTKCLNCNGSGYVKYYYGASDLEAFLDGFDPYTVGKCTMCDGKGY